MTTMARTTYTCELCRQIIPPGTAYDYGLFAGGPWSSGAGYRKLICCEACWPEGLEVLRMFNLGVCWKFNANLTGIEGI
jgi:hypothetical protein